MVVPGDGKDNIFTLLSTIGLIAFCAPAMVTR